MSTEVSEFDWSAPEPPRPGPGAGEPEPEMYQTILPNGLHIRYSSDEEVEAAARRLDPDNSPRAALLNALRRKQRER
ncbi:MAG: hypothetical protein ACREPA_10160 [Candidatus Dormibacteraceae bacterium]